MSSASLRLKRAETVLQSRTHGLLLVLEQCVDSHNHQAVIRTAEALGIQTIYVIDANDQQVKNRHKVGSKKVSKNCHTWLSISHFATITECIAALRRDGRQIWATDLSQEAVALTEDNRSKLAIPPQGVAIVIGRETDGVSEEMLHEADYRIYFPTVGFSESLNLSVATALVCQRLIDWFPQLRGDLSTEAKDELRREWFPQLSSDAEAWIAQPDAIGVLPDVRRETTRTATGQNPWVSKKIRRRELDLEQVQSRQKSSKVLDETA
ncbi:RNA methyltransferase, TrmH superfamily protein [Achlya hypogyna]|uniref:RNA methyltransferase, TrmH superfamily protein n=1 Tax=Achlya hypogyna TaxID=1202772 RepID=A0A1V9ZPI7_ACHHY|nr:RNA methyltransferase, TrmH superfamily protein [Achlya hypogyna]